MSFTCEEQEKPMDEPSLHATVREALYDVAPDLAAKTFDENASLQDDLDLDSADFLNFLIRIHERLGIDVPPQDYRSFATLAGAVHYLEARVLS